MPLAEKVNGPYKAEPLELHGPWRSLDELELATLEYIDWLTIVGLTPPAGTGHRIQPVIGAGDRRGPAAGR